MFSATAARAVADHEFEKTTDLFALELEDRIKSLSTTERTDLMNNLLAVVNNTDATKAFAGGTYSQAKANDGSAAKALGGSSVDPEREALTTLVNSPVLSTGQKQAIKRVLAEPKDPGHIRVESDGTPSEVKTLQGEVTNLTADANNAKKELADERDDSKSGSLAAKLKAAGAPAGTVDKAKVKTEADKIKAALDKSKAKVGFFNGKPNGHQIDEADFKTATKAAEDIVNLVK